MRKNTQKLTKKTQKFAKNMHFLAKISKKMQKKEPQINTDFTATKTSAFAKATADRLRHEEKLDADYVGCADGFLRHFDKAQSGRLTINRQMNESRAIQGITTWRRRANDARVRAAIACRLSLPIGQYPFYSKVQVP